MPNRAPKDGADGGPCMSGKRCKGRMRDTGASWTENGEVKVLYACDDCGFTETRSPEPNALREDAE